MPGTVTSQQNPPQQSAPRDWRIVQTALSHAPEGCPQPPYRYIGGTLGLCCDWPDVTFCGTDGVRYRGDATDVLRLVDLFAEPDRARLLFAAGMEYGIDSQLLVDRNHQPAHDDAYHAGLIDRPRIDCAATSTNGGAA